MEIIRFDPKEHTQILMAWIKERAIDESLFRDLPTTGFLAYSNGIAVATGFLRYVEGHCALLDSLMTDPKAESIDRHVAIDEVVKALIALAKIMKLKGLIAHTIDDGVLQRSFGHGFKQAADVLITLDLTGGN